ncbi:MAG: ThuA domain-containing protein [Propionibacteriaceae bacterium]|nr:ThuA domain-containing protein [Propionibacteriaceae bacterium]
MQNTQVGRSGPEGVHTVTRVVVVSGSGRYADPWHPFEETSAALASIARGLGWDAEVRPSEPDALLDLSDVDVVVVNSGGGDPAAPPEPDDAWAAAHASLGRFAAAGGGLVGVHTASNTFPDWPGWPDLLGGRWVRGESMHPERSIATFEAAPGMADHPLLAGIEAPAGLPALAGVPCVTCYDERYSRLTLGRESTPVLRHELGESYQTSAWLHGRVVYDGLGHDARSYESASRRRFVANALRFVAA